MSRMSCMLRISEAGSLALHTMGFLAANTDRTFSTKQIASSLDVSGAHLSKVLQRLAKAGLVSSARGPAGGFTMRDADKKNTLLQVYEAIEGPLKTDVCLFDKPVCNGPDCIFGDLLTSVNERTREYLSETTLADIAGKCTIRVAAGEGAPT